MTESSRTSGGGEAFDAGQFIRDTHYSIDFTDWAVDGIEDRLIRLEEIVAARWPRSWLLRRRLARELRASVARLDDAMPGLPAGFRGRRAEASALAVSRASIQRRRGTS